MRALVVYESMYGNTHTIAGRIADGIRPFGDVVVASLDEATEDNVAQSDLLIVGGPTHVHGMSSTRSREAAVEGATKAGSELTLDESAPGQGLRDWLDSLTDGKGRSAAAFDTRIDGPAIFTGRASRAIAKGLNHHGFDVIVEPESFLVDRHSHLLDNEGDRAAEWGAMLAQR